jgi:nondiscriminating aspartyl-tRNA synthetase
MQNLKKVAFDSQSDRTLSNELKDKVDQIVSVTGWLYKVRRMGGILFLVVRDRNGLLQSIVESKEEIAKLDNLQNGTILTVNGTVKAEARSPSGVELRDCRVTVDVPITVPAPVEIDKSFEHKSDTLETLFENRVTMLRNIREQAVFRIQAKVKESIRKWFEVNEFIEFNSPKILPGATEGGAEVFKLDYFGQEATLAQSAQFYKQIMVGVFERAYEINPTYRAEPSATTRHMTEFIHIDAEIGFVKFEDLLKLMSDLLNSVVEAVWQESPDQFVYWKAKKPNIPTTIPSLRVDEIHKLYSANHEDQTVGEPDLRPDEERWICNHAQENLGSEALFVTHWPSSSMKFYHRKYDDQPEFAQRFDLLFRGVEIATGSMRENRYEQILTQLAKIGADVEHPGFKYYLQAFRHGMPAHGGFGMGLERLVQKLIGLGSAKEASLFPRDLNRLSP